MVLGHKSENLAQISQLYRLGQHFKDKICTIREMLIDKRVLRINRILMRNEIIQLLKLG
ncbi:MAG: hypothetical protein ACFFBH_12060 [Promethearchaeota archaeon]